MPINSIQKANIIAYFNNFPQEEISQTIDHVEIVSNEKFQKLREGNRPNHVIAIGEHSYTTYEYRYFDFLVGYPRNQQPAFKLYAKEDNAFHEVFLYSDSPDDHEGDEFHYNYGIIRIDLHKLFQEGIFRHTIQRPIKFAAAFKDEEEMTLIERRDWNRANCHTIKKECSLPVDHK